MIENIRSRETTPQHWIEIRIEKKRISYRGKFWCCLFAGYTVAAALLIAGVVIS